jgi:hypothetical protein
MAGPSIVVRVLGDLTGLGSSFDKTAAQGQSAATKMHSAFSGALGTLNQAGVLGPFGASLATADAAIQTMAGHAKSIGPIMQGVGGAALGVGLALQAAGSKDAAAHAQLQAAIGATGKSYDDYAVKIEASIKHQENFGNTADETQNALKTLTQATHDPGEALNLLSTAADLAATKHESLDTAASQLGKTYNGSSRLLKQFGVDTDGTGTKQQKLQAELASLSKILSGQASAAAGTFTGHLDSIKAKVEDQVAVFGQKWGPAITAAGIAVTALGTLVELTGGVISFFRDSEILATVWTYALGTAMTVLDAALDANPFTLLAIAIGVVLVGAVVLIITHFNEFKRIVEDVWQVVLIGFGGIKAVIMDVVNWITANWPLLLAILTGPIGLAIYFITTNFDTLVGYVTGLPGRLASAGAHMWDWVSSTFKGVLNDVINAWNSLKFTTPSVDIFGLHTPSVTIGVPQIPHLAQGGLITQSGLVYAHAGEAITPIPANIGGPAVSIQNAHFATELDVDTFMRRAAWVARTRQMARA